MSFFSDDSRYCIFHSHSSSLLRGSGIGACLCTKYVSYSIMRYSSNTGGSAGHSTTILHINCYENCNTFCPRACVFGWKLLCVRTKISENQETNKSLKIYNIAVHEKFKSASLLRCCSGVSPAPRVSPSPPTNISIHNHENQGNFKWHGTFSII